MIYRDELLGDAHDYGLDLRFALTREWPEACTGHTGRIDRPLLEVAIGAPADRPLVYICGPNAFVEAASGLLVEIGHDPAADQDRALRPDRDLRAFRVRLTGARRR